jgi:hypothetical protein
MLRAFFNILKTCDHPDAPNLRDALFEDLFPDGLGMGTAILGKQGSGKTTASAGQVVAYMKKYPGRAIFIIDWSGSLTNEILKLIMMEPQPLRDQLLKRIVYDELGNQNYVVPLPEFSPDYGTSVEEQVSRVRENLLKLHKVLAEGATFLGGEGIKHLSPMYFKVATAIKNERGENWQVTEVKRLILDQALLKNALREYGKFVPDAKWYLEKFLNIRPAEQELRTAALVSVMTEIEPREVRARLGYFKPGWTPQEAVQKGLMVIVTGQKMINQEKALHYLVTQVFSLILAEINKREPADPNVQPALLVLDEVYTLIEVAGMAEEIGKISPIYRSRKLQLIVVLQALWQLDDKLKEQIWSLGNVWCFGTDIYQDAETVARNLIYYYPTMVKQGPRTATQNPITEPNQGQYNIHANWIMNFKHRELVMRRYYNEKEKDKYIRHVRQTKDVPVYQGSLAEIKDWLLKQRAVSVRDALEVINQRKLTIASRSPGPRQV